MGVFALPEHSLRFHKIGRDGSAKCDAFFTGHADDTVHGVIFELDPAEIPSLDAAEDLGRGYEKRTVTVLGSEAAGTSAFAYFALRTDPGLKPFPWYKQHVLAGARYAGLSQDYIRKIERVPTSHDPDPARERRELAVYRLKRT
jgi:hypothetical protein